MENTEEGTFWTGTLFTHLVTNSGVVMADMASFSASDGLPEVVINLHINRRYKWSLLAGQNDMTTLHCLVKCNQQPVDVKQQIEAEDNAQKKIIGKCLHILEKTS